jgi:hypothetical protein
MLNDLADEDGEIADAYVTLCIHAGIAAADVICCIRIGEHATGEDHAEAVKIAGCIGATFLPGWPNAGTPGTN